VLAFALPFDGKAEEALQRAGAALKVRPAWRSAVRAAAAASVALERRDAQYALAHSWVAAAAANLGETETARAALASSGTAALLHDFVVPR